MSFVRPFILLTLFMLSACSGQVRHMVPAEFRDTVGRYDGQWVARLTDTRATQNIQGWEIKCKPMNLAIPMIIENGVVTTRINDEVFTGFISSSGRFRLEIPTDLQMSASVRSESKLNNASITLILQGDLSRKPPSGGFTLGVADLGNRGCTTSVQYLEQSQLQQS